MECASGLPPGSREELDGDFGQWERRGNQIRFDSGVGTMTNYTGQLTFPGSGVVLTLQRGNGPTYTFRLVEPR